MGWLEAFVWFCVCQSMEQEEGRRAGLPDTSQRGGCLCFRNIHVDGKELSGPFMSLPDTGELLFDFSYRRTVPPGCFFYFILFLLPTHSAARLFFILFYFSYRRTVPPGCPSTLAAEWRLGAAEACCFGALAAEACCRVALWLLRLCRRFRNALAGHLVF